MRYQTFKSTCSYCGVGCGVVVKKDHKGRLQLEGDKDHPVNRGMLCSKGRNLHYVVQDKSDRLLFPEMRGARQHPRQRVSWDAALTRAAAVFQSMIRKYGPDSVGFYVSGQCLTEEYYLVNKLAKGFLGTNNIDTNSRLCMSSAVAAYTKTLGEDAVPISYEDIELADCFLIAGANPAWCHPILFRRLEKHKEENPNVKIVVVDPRKTQTCSIADLHLQILPGTDVVLYNAIARRLLETGQVDVDFIAKHTEGLKNYRMLLAGTSLKKAAKICGIEVNDIKLAAQYIGNAEGFISMWAMGLNQSVIGTDKNFALLNLSLLTGQIGKPGSGPFSLTGQPNAMGGREVGGMASLLAAHRIQSNPEHRREVADFWGVDTLPDKPGLTATKMFEALESGKMKAVWIICTNPLTSLPNSRRIEKALEKARFVIVQDISRRSDTAAYADLLLPAAGWLEKDGTMTNSDRRISYLSKVVDPPGEALPDAEILWRFAQKMGFRGFDYQDASEVYDEHCRLTKNTNIDISGLSHKRLQEEGTFQWPVPFDNHPGTPRLFVDKQFYTISGKAQFNTPVYTENRSEPTDKQHPLVLMTGRIRDQWHTMTRTGKVNRLNSHIPEPYLEINYFDAMERDLKNGDLAVVRNGRGQVRVKVKISTDIKSGVVFLPMHWGKILNRDFARANNLTQGLIDPVSKQPDFKYSAVQVERYRKPRQKICVIGAGAAAYRFIQTYREKNTEDEIQVFSKEPYPFYNRVLLPEYVSEELTWDQLVKIKTRELENLRVQMHAGVSITSINRKEKTILDSEGWEHDYDLLIMATGSRAFVPREVPTHLEGVFTMRCRRDADKLKQFLGATGLPTPEQHVLIIGGGLLGLELAAALRKTAIQITIVQRGSRLMERQLDPIASKLLAEDVMERDINIYFDNEVSTIFQEEEANSLHVSLKSGKSIQCHAVVYAIGTRPNIELGKAIGLDIARGIIVNDYLQSSDPDIFAIGEIAEFKQELYGITAAAEQQADILARFIAGDGSSTYRGSVPMNILKFEDLSLCSIGRISVPANDPAYEEVIMMDVSRRYYKKCIVYQDRLIGALLLGDKSEFAEFKGLIEDKIELSEKRNELLRGGNEAPPVKGRLVCSCNNVGVGNLQEAIRGGCTDFNDLCKNTGAGLGCGSCKPEVKTILQATRKHESGAIHTTLAQR
ncbi:nitrate reductase [Flavilitoribacter nigricans]|uniref:NAD(P)H-nitrite reductase n=1 Tax=Flavilitoribacter nigricans (strain ATCC 23147 / DSM 23189 / NBRC 102662 / NCIMB 1420 / SS-2) TaxID=1122177 RepID=A0A2D0N6J1_FLAN2|nr:nitrate reductase [Flavilitoribacter nigricans]PHN03769.1 NAD(P)H-nitrite reductase [Flavilitoribacter nigricans DSM 23189 = NBRC 102662]